MVLIGKNKDFKVIFNCDTQCYTVYKNDKILITNKYKFSDIQSYLN